MEMKIQGGPGTMGPGGKGRQFNRNPDWKNRRNQNQGGGGGGMLVTKNVGISKLVLYTY